MRRVYITHTLKQFTSPMAIKIYIVAILLWQMTARVSLTAVLANAQSASVSFSSMTSFAQSAISNAEVITQVLTLAVLALALWLCRDIFSRQTHSQLAS